MRSNINDSNLTAEERERMKAGKEGKLWRVEIVGRIQNEDVIYRRENMYYDELIRLRETAYKAGLMLPLDPGHFRIIHPLDIVLFDAWKQKDFYYPKF